MTTNNCLVTTPSFCCAKCHPFIEGNNSPPSEGCRAAVGWSNILTIASFLLTASFVFADGETIQRWDRDTWSRVNAISLPDSVDVFKVENDQSVPKTVRVATIEYKPKSSMYVVRGDVQYRDVEGAAYLEMWSVMPDGSRYFSRTLADSGPMQKIQGSSYRWLPFELPFNLMEHKPESVTLEINIVMPGKGTIEVTGLTVSDTIAEVTGITVSDEIAIGTIDVPVPSELVPTHANFRLGVVVGLLSGCYGGLFGILCGVLVPRGKGQRLVYGMIFLGFVVGVIFLTAGLTAMLCGQPSHVWHLSVIAGITLMLGFPVFFLIIRRQYAQVELRKMQALDA